ncbi:unnamed protein product [Hymenolepis diminuta]|uniref:Uncharacterized protein n=1 Tax=Hymenolepis diminuta TaxID=6216 RepID=A0A564YEM2_HYMDI|nr:unnamed protein product [Hymenolepis diminuta]
MMTDPLVLTDPNIINHAPVPFCDNCSCLLATQSIITSINWCVNSKPVLNRLLPIRVDPFAFRITTIEAAHFEYATAYNMAICSKRTNWSSTIFIAVMDTCLSERNTLFVPGFRINLVVACVHFPKVSSNTVANRFIISFIRTCGQVTLCTFGPTI